MASKTRRSGLAKADGYKDCSINSPKDVPIRGRRSSHASVTTTNIKQNSHSPVLEKLYEDPIDRPERKKKENISKKKLTENEISETLNLSDEELYTGAIERTMSSSRSNETPRKLRCTVGKLNYGEDELMKKYEEEWRDRYNSATPSRNRKIDKSKTTNQVAEISPRKRTKQNTQQPEFHQNDDENEMYQANQIISPPKRPKSENEIEQTPKKNFHLKNLQSTPRSAAKRKILADPENVHSHSRMSTRESTKKNSHGKYSEYSSSDDNAREKLDCATVILEKLDKPVIKKFNKQSSKNTLTSESGESEIENKMSNANKSSTPRNTRLRSKSIQPSEQTYSPTKDMEKLNISKTARQSKKNREEGHSDRERLILKVPKSLVSTPSNTPKANTEKQHNTRRKSQRTCANKNYHYINDSEDESADSSDDYKGEESSESEESIESGNDSAEEFQELSRTKRNLRNRGKVPVTPKTHKRVNQISMDTPTKAISRMSIGTPTLDKHRRTTSISKPSTPLQKARATLHVSVLPKSLPCREEQFNDIYSFLHARLSDGSGGCIYISGVPGTGKTATVSEVICCLKKSMTKGELPDFDYIEINGMKLSEPRQAYVQIWRQMTGETKTWEESHKLLQNKFTNSNSKRKMTLLLVDELDLLCTKRQDVVYNLLDWPSKTNAKLVVVTIANTMDLPERILMGKVTSRLGLTRLTFPPYNFKQLEEIVVSRLKGVNAFGGETIQLVARKVAAVSGDARRALDICRRSAEIAERNGREQVSMVDVKQALDEMIASPKIQAIKHCSDMEKYFLQAVCTEVQRTGVEEVVFKNVYMQMETLSSLDGITPPNVSEALEMCARLGSWRLLLCDHSRMDIHQRLLLNVSTDDVYFATREINE